jgi:Heterokaryon incompatibility protein (HET)
MRLLKTNTFKIESFFGEKIPRYAILSHTWGDYELSFQNWPNRHLSLHTEGFTKIKGACEQAFMDDIEYIWVDTICIDKTNNVELSEAINSMYDWYSKSAICYAYLVDVLDDGETGDNDIFQNEDLKAKFTSSRWFTRGWTLQELLAPSKLSFFLSSWKKLGTKHTLAQLISDTTGITAPYLYTDHLKKSISEASIAIRMSWLSKRRTTRVEDLAYCVLGIFEINMPLLYGEGTWSFVRLQEEIIRRSHDLTIFCWEWDRNIVPHDWGNILAPSPSLFYETAEIYEPLAIDSPDAAPYSLTNLGLSIKLPFIHTTNSHNVCAVLEGTEDKIFSQRLCIPLSRSHDDRYYRIPFPARPFPIHDAVLVPSQSTDFYAMSQKINPYLSISSDDSTSAFTDGFFFIFSMQTAIFTCPNWSYSGEGFDGIDHFGEFQDLQSVFGFRRMKNEPFLGSILKYSSRISVDEFLILLAIRYRDTKHNYYCQILPSKYWKESETSPVLRSILQKVYYLSEKVDSDITFSYTDGVTIMLGETIKYSSTQTCKALHIIFGDRSLHPELTEHSSCIPFDL